jgi:CHAD domain-containing protein
VAMEGEREAKFEVGPDFRLPSLDDRLDVGVRDAGTQALEATYYDTASLDLARWGMTLRFRATLSEPTVADQGNVSSAKWTLKLPDPAGAPDLISRTEVDFDGGPGQPPSEAQDLIQAHRRGRHLEPVCELTTTRTRYLLVPAGATDVGAEIDDDSVQFRTANGRTGSFREIEVELKDGDSGPLLPVVAKALTEAGGNPGSNEPKVLRALGWKAPRLPPPALTNKSTVELVVSYAIADSTRRLLSNEPMVRLGDEAEPVHQARVATRRLRSDLSTLKRLLRRKALRELRSGLKELGGSLGDLRDTDVMLDGLRQSVGELPPSESRAAAVYVDLLYSQRRDARSAVLACLESAEYVSTVDRLVDAIDHPPVGDPDLRAAAVLPSLVASRWRDLKRRVDHLGDAPADSELHLVRIDAKRCRYAAELAAPVVGKKAASMAKALADVQTALGELQDAVVLERWLRSAASNLPRDEAALAKRMVATERRRAASARRAWQKPWRRISGQRLDDWLV